MFNRRNQEQNGYLGDEDIGARVQASSRQCDAETGSPAVEAASVHHGMIVPTLTLTPIQPLPSASVRTGLMHPRLQNTRVRKIYYTASTGGSVSVSVLLPPLLLPLWSRFGACARLGAIERAEKAIGGSQGRGSVMLWRKGNMNSRLDAS